VKLLNTIGKKIWFCVNVALIGFIVATGFALYSNQQLKIHLSHIRDLDFNLAIHSNDLLNLFALQNNFYKESFLFGSPESADKGNSLCEGVIKKIKEINEIQHSTYSLPLDRAESLSTLKKRYQEYSNQATELYPLLAQGKDPGDHIEALQYLAASQNEILSNMEYFSKHYHQNFSHNVTTLIDTTSRNSSYLAVFFITLLVAMSLIVNWAAKRTLITPLNHIKEAVRAFGRGQRSFPALEVMDSCDDIGELGEAIITMTKDLVKTTVNKDYVDSILHNMNDSLIVTSMSFHIRSVNRATLNLLGYESDELIGRHINTISRGPLGGYQNCESSYHDDKLEFHSCGKNEESFFTKDGHIIPVLLSTALLKNGDTENQGFVYVAKDITDRKETEEKLKQMALYDFLTGLANRGTFNDRLEHALKQARRENNQTGLMFIDLDRFKKINDTLGHDSGDALLKKVAEWLQKSVRECDTVARLGGDEFAIILENINVPQDAITTADRILAAFTTPVRYDGKEFFTSPSIGIAVYPGDAAKAEDLLKYADLAMYQAKENGGNDYSFFSQKKNE